MKLLFALTLLLLSACVGQTPVPGGGPPPPVDSLKLASGDKLKITTYGEPTLTGEFQVTPAGVVAFPLIGDMQAAGLDPAALGSALQAKLGAGYLLNPKVAVEVLNYRPIYVLGEVQKPGEYPYTPGLTIRGAIAKADGYTYRANQNKVFVKRAGEAGETEYPMTADFAIMPGDTVRFFGALFLMEETGEAHLRGCAVSFAKLKALLAADLYRYAGRVDLKSFIRHYAFTPGYKYTVLMRTCGWLKRKPAKAFGLYPLAKLMLLRARYKYGFAIPEYTEIGPGLFLNRFGGFYIHGDAVLGSNVNLTHGVVLGYMNRGARQGAPVIGDRSFLGSGAKIIGGIHVGEEAAIGANAVVTKDVPDRGVVVGIPAKLVSDQGSDGYINRMAPQPLLSACIDAYPGSTRVKTEPVVALQT